MLILMPFFMDRHEFTGLTATDAANMHLKDMELQDTFGVQLLTYWFDYDRQTAFCLANAPSADAVRTLHGASHGAIPNQVIEVDQAFGRPMPWPICTGEPAASSSAHCT